MKQTKFPILVPFLALCCAVGASGQAVADEIDWQKYMNSAAVVSSIAAAIAMVSPCENPLEFSETVEGDSLRLNVNCVGGEDDEATAVIEFTRYGDGLLVPEKFYFAG